MSEEKSQPIVKVFAGEIISDVAVKAYLEANGFDGLYSAEFECGCGIGDLWPCTSEGPGADCRGGHKIPGRVGFYGPAGKDKR